MSDAKVYDVAIVGCGPAGIVAAALLGQQGLSVYACERLPGVYEIPRAISLDHEIQRVFQQIGVMEAVAPYCEPFTPSEYLGVDGRLIRRMGASSPEPDSELRFPLVRRPKVDARQDAGKLCA